MCLHMIHYGVSSLGCWSRRDGSFSRTRSFLLLPLDKTLCLALCSYFSLDTRLCQSAGEPPSAPLRERKKRLLQKWLSIREKWGGQREKKTRSGSTEKRVKQHTASKTPSPAALPGWHSPPKVCRCVSSHSWDYFGHLVSLRSAVNTDVCIFSSSSFYFFDCFASLRWTDGVGFSPLPPT